MIKDRKQISPIYKRVSTRGFTSKVISEKILYDIIHAGTYAPSSGNMQPWEFIVVGEKENKIAIVSATFSGFYSDKAPHQTWIQTASKIIVICKNMKRTASRYGDLSEKWTLIDVASAVQNMILTATNYGVDSCWVGGIKENVIRKNLGIPDYVSPIGLLTLGYAEKKDEPKYKMDPEWITHAEQYNHQYYKKGTNC